MRGTGIPNENAARDLPGDQVRTAEDGPGVSRRFRHRPPSALVPAATATRRDTPRVLGRPDPAGRPGQATRPGPASGAGAGCPRGAGSLLAGPAAPSSRAAGPVFPETERPRRERGECLDQKPLSG
jgi:hypothetical protein